MKFSFKSAAEQVLKTEDEPLTAREITERALEEGLLKTEGATPEATMAAQLYVDTKDNPDSRFKRVGKGKFTLRENEESASSAQLIIEKQNALVRAELRKQLHEMDPYQFEMLIGELLEKLGYENVDVTKRSGDKGIDIVADLTLQGITNVKTIVQVKRFNESNKISGAVVTQLRGSAEVDQRGLIVTLSDFTSDGRAEAKAPNKMPVSLVNGSQLIDLMFKHEVGVKREILPLFSVDTDYLESFEGSETLAGQSGKRKAIWPLPGGVDGYVDTLLRCLEMVSSGTDTKGALANWFIQTFETVTSDKTAGGYVNVPRIIGLTNLTGGKLILTEAGRQFLETRDNGMLYRIMDENVVGISALVEFLETAGEPKSANQVLDFFNESLDVTWETLAQANYRLSWLLCLGKIRKVDGGYVAVKD